jgi:phage terminase large subunit-like protein
MATTTTTTTETTTAETVRAFVDGVLDGTIAACKWTRLAAQRHLDDERHAHKRGFYHDPEVVEDWVCFFRCLKHFEGDFAGQPIELDPWELFIVWNVFGWMREGGTRRFKTVYIEIARKVGKSTFAAGLGLGLLVIDGEAGPQVYSAAVNKSHARKVLHNKAEKYRRHSSALRRRLDYEKTTGRISFEVNDGYYEPLGKDSDTGEGFNPHGTIFDELHAHPDRQMWDVIDSGLGARSQPLKIAITTAGFDCSSFCYTEIRDQVCSILDGAIADDEWWGCIWSIDEGDDWQDESVWAKANPQTYFPRQIDDMRRMAKEAARKAGALNNFLTKRLNVWTTTTLKWVNMVDWKAAPAAIPERELIGRRCWSALDLSANKDLTSLTHVFEIDQGELAVLCRFWIPGAQIQERERGDAAQYERWVREGWIKATPGRVIDYEIVKTDILNDAGLFCIEQLAYDPYGPAEAIRQDLIQRGLDEELMVEFLQRYNTFNPAMLGFERLYTDRRVRGLENPVLTWMAGNLQARMAPDGNVRPDKSATRPKGQSVNTKRIDGMVTLLMATGVWLVKPAPKESVYEERGLLTIESDDESEEQ